MSSLPRKTTSNSIGGQRGGASNALSKGALPSSQYLDALNVLCEQTMDAAISLALSDKDHTTAHTKLLEIEKKCREAAKVIHKEAVVTPAVALPPSMPTIPAARVNPNASKKATTTVGKSAPKAAPKGMVGKSISQANAAKSSLMRRGSMAGGRQGQGKRTAGEDTGGPGSAHGAGNKKARLGNAATSASSNSLASASSQKKSQTGGSSSLSGAGESDAPPPSALSFLKKLNQDKAATAAAAAESNTTSSSKQSTKEKTESIAKTRSGKKAEKEAEKEQQEDADYDESDEASEASSSDRKDSPPAAKNPPREGTRKNPTRGARK